MHPEVICLDSDSDCSNSPINKRASVPQSATPTADKRGAHINNDTDTDDELLKPTITDMVRSIPFVSTCTIDLDEDDTTIPKQSSPSIVSSPSPPKISNERRNRTPPARQLPPPVPKAGTDTDDCIIILDDDGDDIDAPSRIEWNSQQKLGSPNRNGNRRACANDVRHPWTPNNPRRITARKPPRNADTDVHVTSSESSSVQSSLVRNLRAIKPTASRMSAPLGSSIVRKKARKKTKTSAAVVANAIVPDDGATHNMDMTEYSSEIGEGVNSATDSTTVALSGKPKKKKKRDRDEVSIVSSAQLMGIKEYKEITKKIGEMEESMLNLVFTKVDELAVPNIIEWRRTGQFDERVTVDAVAYWYTATDFVELMRKGQVEGIAKTLRSSYSSDVTVFIIVSGMASYCRKAIKQAANINGSEILITRDALEDCAASLWFHHDMQANMFDTAKECAAFLVCTAYAIGRKHYSTPLERANLRDAYVHGKTSKEHAALCVDSDTGGVRAETNKDTGAGYQAILALVPGVSADKAKVIRKHYPTLKKLLEAYRNCADTRTAQKLLANVQDENGARKKIGPALSLKLWKVLASNDPDISVA